MSEPNEDVDNNMQDEYSSYMDYLKDKMCKWDDYATQLESLRKVAEHIALLASNKMDMSAYEFWDRLGPEPEGLSIDTEESYEKLKQGIAVLLGQVTRDAEVDDD